MQLGSKDFEFISVKQNHVLKFRLLIDNLNLIAQKPHKVINGRNYLKCPDLKCRKPSKNIGKNLSKLNESLNFGYVTLVLAALKTFLTSQQQ